MVKGTKLELDKGNKYRKIMPSVAIDVYDIIKAYEITNPALQHAIKKLLVAGGRGGGKSWKQDLQEAQWSIDRAIELMENKK